jgi:hypothetical protein
MGGVLPSGEVFLWLVSPFAIGAATPEYLPRSATDIVLKFTALPRRANENRNIPFDLHPRQIRIRSSERLWISPFYGRHPSVFGTLRLPSEGSESLGNSTKRPVPLGPPCPRRHPQVHSPDPFLPFGNSCLRLDAVSTRFFALPTTVAFEWLLLNRDRLSSRIRMNSYAISHRRETEKP